METGIAGHPSKERKQTPSYGKIMTFLNNGGKDLQASRKMGYIDTTDQESECLQHQKLKDNVINSSRF